MNNRKWNAKNPHQNSEEFPRVLCLCSAGLLRSPTTAWVLSNPPYNFNTRAAGLTEDFALVPVDDVLYEWAQMVVVMEQEQAEEVKKHFSGPIINLSIPDEFDYRNDVLVNLIRERFDGGECVVQ